MSDAKVLQLDLAAFIGQQLNSKKAVITVNIDLNMSFYVSDSARCLIDQVSYLIHNTGIKPHTCAVLNANILTVSEDTEHEILTEYRFIGFTSNELNMLKELEILCTEP